MSTFSLQVAEPSRTMDINTRSGRHLLSYFDRSGAEGTILYVHGLGTSKRDFADMCHEPALDGYRLISYDHPGCNESPSTVDHPDSIDCLVEILEHFVIELDLNKFLLVGGSMGGLVALLFAERNPDRITGFVNVEGNLKPEDCLFSRLAVPHTYENFELAIFPQIKLDLAQRKGAGFANHLKVLGAAASRSYYAFSFQTVAYSDGGRLLERFLDLPVPIFFFYGSENRHLSYLPNLRDSRCDLTEFEDADHFLFYDAPKAYANALQTCANGCHQARDAGTPKHA
jgi:pimeloyl-ACP methyl ester carboxylesterase